MRPQFLRSSEKKKLVEEIKEAYGIEELPFLLLEVGKQKIRAYSGNLSKDEITQLAHIVRVETMGLYILSKRDGPARINFDALPILKDQITKNIVKINEEQLNSWIRGNDLEIEAQEGFVVLQYQEDLVGTGKSTGNKILNYIPKERQIKSQTQKTIYNSNN
ncbi:MAG: hypothetical protein Q7S74_04980 [Nanoarchaeota archaeon]|nr:hypothetical protein [Nanoarchaeota archaeon]